MSAMKLIPLKDRVLVSRRALYKFDPESGMATDEKTGLTVPAEAVDKSPLVRILAIGAGCSEDFRKKIHVGDMVLIGQVATVDNTDQMLIMEEEILALCQPE